MRILFLTQLFEPEPVMKGTAMVRALEKAGHHVDVLTGFPNYPTGRIYSGYSGWWPMREEIDGVRITRLPLWPSHNDSALRRAIHFLSFTATATLWLWLKARRYDLLYVGHPGVTTGLAALVGGGLYGRPYVVEIQDLWPDSLTASGMGGASRLAKIMQPVCNLVHHRAARIIAQSAGMARELVARGAKAERVTTIYNWSSNDHALTHENASATSERIVICYGGNMGPLQGLDTAIRAAKIAGESNPNVILQLFGGGVEAERLELLAGDIGATNVEFLERTDTAGAAARFAVSDALLLNLSGNALLSVTIPSKTQAYLAMGKPIIAAVRGEVAEILQQSAAALIVPPDDAPALAAAMLSFATLAADQRSAMGAAGRAYYENTMQFDAGIAATLTVLERAVAERN